MGEQQVREVGERKMTEEQYAAIRAELAANDQEHQSYNRRLAEHDDALKELSKTQVVLERLSNSVANLATAMGEVKTAVQNVDKRVADIEREPADNWKKITYKIIEAVVLAVAAFAIGYFSKGA